jgi:drug/metabolite transporter (DMT)-like permease
MPYYIFAWIASFTAGIYVLIMKLTGKYSIKNPWFFNFLWSFAVLLFTGIPTLFKNAFMPNDWFPLILSAIFSALFQIFFILSMEKLDISTISPLFNFRSVFAVLFGMLFLGEIFSLHQWVIAGIIVLAGILATMDENFNLKSFFKPAIAIGILTMLFLAISNAIAKQALVHNDLWSFNLWNALIKLGIAGLAWPLFKNDFVKIKPSQLIAVGLLAIFSTIANVTASIGYKANVGITSLIMAVPFSMIMVFILSFFAPKLLEKHSLKVYALRFAAAIIMIYGSIQITK